VRAAFPILCLVAVALGGCRRPAMQRVSSVETRPYPTCDGVDALPEGEVLAEGTLASGPGMVEQSVVERFELRRRACLHVLRATQAWSRSTTDLEVVYDAQLLPLRIWERTSSPDATGPFGHRVLRLFDFRGRSPTIQRRVAERGLEGFELAGERPRAVVVPGRGGLTAWLRRAQLEEGQRVVEPALDVRDPIVRTRQTALTRLEDREVEGLGRVRVYTVFGREPFYADEHDVVVGDLLGLRSVAALTDPPPPPESPGPFEVVAPL
jgi:hypothetical protein